MLMEAETRYPMALKNRFVEFLAHSLRNFDARMVSAARECSKWAEARCSGRGYQNELEKEIACVDSSRTRKIRRHHRSDALRFPLWPGSIAAKMADI
jgi:hypothetical protein